MTIEPADSTKLLQKYFDNYFGLDEITGKKSNCLSFHNKKDSRGDELFSAAGITNRRTEEHEANRQF